jgi:sigma-70-like protein
MTGSASAAEDLVQDVFVRVMKYRETWRGEGRFETWLFRIARNAPISGTINDGGPDFELRAFNGNIYVKKGK